MRRFNRKMSIKLKKKLGKSKWVGSKILKIKLEALSTKHGKNNVKKLKKRKKHNKNLENKEERKDKKFLSNHKRMLKNLLIQVFLFRVVLLSYKSRLLKTSWKIDSKIFQNSFKRKSNDKALIYPSLNN